MRIRKLARELRRSPDEVIGVLHALGFVRFLSADDMLSDTTVQKLRRGLQKGVQPISVQTRTPAAEDSAGRPVRKGSGDSDLMGQLIPGVSPGLRPSRSAGRRQGPAPRPPARPAPRAPEPAASAPPVPAPVPAAAAPVSDPDGVLRRLATERATLESLERRLSSERVVLATEKAALQQLQSRTDARAGSLEGERAALDALRQALDAERAALDAERAALTSESDRRSDAYAGLQELLEERGLRGTDEFERALGALLQGRHLRDALWSFRVDAPDLLRRVLRERLMLVSGEPFAGLGTSAAAVTVAPDRAEVPDAPTVAALLTKLSERLLLHGMRRVLLVGGRPVWHRLMREGLDARLVFKALPPAARDRHRAATDVVQADLIVLWGVAVDAGAREVYDSDRSRAVVVGNAGFRQFLDTVLAALNDD